MAPRVIGIDPGTVTIDLCGLAGDRVFLDRALPTADALANPNAFVDLLRAAGPVALVAAPSGYGLPLTPAAEVTDEMLRLAFLAPAGESGGIGGLRRLARALADSGLPAVFLPGVVHLPSVPPHRKVNRVDLGTADKVCAAALAITEQARRERCAPGETSLILLELGGAFTAALAVAGGAIVDGAGGTVGAMGFRAAGALDGEVAFLAGEVTKSFLFRGGVTTVAGDDGLSPDALAAARGPRTKLALDAFVESLAKVVASLLVSVRTPREIVLSGRLARVEGIRTALARRLSDVAPVRRLDGLASAAKEGAQGAALIADGLAGGRHAELVESLGIRAARGTVLDHLYVVPPEAARGRLGLE